MIPPNINFASNVVQWSVKIDPPDSRAQSRISNKIRNANTSFMIVSDYFQDGSKYTFIANISAYNWTGNTTIKINTFRHSVTYISSLDTKFLAWWQDDGHLIGCDVCSRSNQDNNSLGCYECVNGMQLVNGECRCGWKTKYIELDDEANPNCEQKTKSSFSLSWLSDSPTMQFLVSFENSFLDLEENAQFVTQRIGVQFSDLNIEISQFSATLLNGNILLDFTTANQIAAATTISLNISFVDEYNLLPFSPFYLKSGNISYKFPQSIISLSNTTKDAVTQAGNIASDAMIIQSATSSVFPIFAGGFATTAIFLIDFVGDVVDYRYINVPFPNSFVVFSQILDSNFLPNPYSSLGNDPGVMQSNIGNFNVFSYSTVMLQNSASNLNREAFVLGVVAILSILSLIKWKSSRITNRLQKLQDSFRWRIFLSFYISDVPDVFLSSIVQINENTSYGSYSQFSLGLSYIILISTPIFVGLLIYYSNRKASRRNQVAADVEFEPETGSPDRFRPVWKEVPKSISMIAEDFRQDCWFNRNFMTVIIMENLCVSLLLALLQSCGLAQAILYTFITVVYIVLVLIYRPLKSKIQKTIFFSNQGCKVIMGVVSILYGVQNEINFLTANAINGLAIALIVLILTTIALNLILTVIAIIPSICSKCSKCKKKRTARVENIAPVSLVASISLRENDANSLQVNPLSPRGSSQRYLIDEKEISLNSLNYGENNMDREEKNEESRTLDQAPWVSAFKRRMMAQGNRDSFDFSRQNSTRNRSFNSLRSPTRVHILANSNCEGLAEDNPKARNSEELPDGKSQIVLFDFERRYSSSRMKPGASHSPSIKELTPFRFQYPRESNSRRDSLELNDSPLPETKKTSSPNVSYRVEPLSAEFSARNPSFESETNNNSGDNGRSNDLTGSLEVLDLPSVSRRPISYLDFKSSDTTRYKGRSLFSLKSNQDLASTMTDKYLSSKNLEADSKSNEVDSNCFSLQHLSSPKGNREIVGSLDNIEAGSNPSSKNLEDLEN